MLLAVMTVSEVRTARVQGWGHVVLQGVSQIITVAASKQQLYKNLRQIRCGKSVSIVNKDQ